MKQAFFKLALPIATVAALGFALSPQSEAETTPAANPDEVPAVWENLFDGKTLFGWNGNPENWSVENGAIVGRNTEEKPLQKNTFLVWQGGDLADFHLKVDFKLEGGNSGIQYRSQLVEDEWTMKGYQADFESGDTYSGILYEERGRGILAQRGQQTEIGDNGKPKVTGSVGDSAEINSKIKKGDWNTYEVIAQGDHIIHMINGVITSEVTDKDPKNFRDRGLLGFQVHKGPAMKVSFKNIQLRRMKPADKKKIVFMAGHRSHGYGSHEHRAGCLLLANQLNKHAADQVYAEVRLAKDWPANFNALKDADAIVFYCDGGGGHMANSHLEELDIELKDGTGLACLHYGVETTKGERSAYFNKWMGGSFEVHWSVNPHWEADFTKLPDHPITNGVQPFKVHDEWYFNMRFVPEMKGVTPILTAVPPLSTIERKDGPHSGNEHVRKIVQEQQPVHVAWAYERPEGGRGFGFTGGHFHKNWGNDNFRKTVLNALAWVAQAEVPADGIPSDKITEKDLEKNQDYPKP
ncbi:MAG: family 16 glycoside hydrolase [Verrucomicrobiales bacterium]